MNEPMKQWLEKVRTALNNLESDPSEANVRTFMERGGELASIVLRSLNIKGFIAVTTTAKCEDEK